VNYGPILPNIRCAKERENLAPKPVLSDSVGVVFDWHMADLVERRTILGYQINSIHLELIVSQQTTDTRDIVLQQIVKPWVNGFTGRIAIWISRSTGSEYCIFVRSSRSKSVRIIGHSDHNLATLCP
jgi:hypothetical protein